MRGAQCRFQPGDWLRQVTTRYISFMYSRKRNLKLVFSKLYVSRRFFSHAINGGPILIFSELTDTAGFGKYSIKIPKWLPIVGVFECYEKL